MEKIETRLAGRIQCSGYANKVEHGPSTYSNRSYGMDGCLLGYYYSMHVHLLLLYGTVVCLPLLYVVQVCTVCNNVNSTFIYMVVRGQRQQ